MWHPRIESHESAPVSPNRGDSAPRSGRITLSGILSDVGEFSANAEVQAFDRIRTDTYDRMGQEIVERLTSNPTPIHEERVMGTYVEALEPQVRGAIMTMRAKGYNTRASGFHGSDDDWKVLGIDNPARTYDPSNRRGQTMNFDRPLQLAPETMETLTTMGVELLEWPGEPGVALIGFTPVSPNMEAITAQWDAIADVLPDTGVPAGPRMGTLEATGFGIYRPPDISWPIAVFNDVATQAAANFDASASDAGVSGGEAPV